MSVGSKYIRIAITGLIVSFLFCKGLSQYLFTNYDYSNGLPLNEIHAFAQDSLGYIWMGGPEGLVKFDGNEFQHFTHNELDSFSIAGNIVSDIEVSASGKVWISFDDNGISLYDHQSGSFRSRKYKVEDENNFPKYTINNIFIENDSIVWMGSVREGLYNLDIPTWKSHIISSEIRPNSIIVNEDDTNYLFCAGKGIYQVNKKTYKTEKITSQGHNGLVRIGNKLWAHDYFNFLISYDLFDQIEEKYEGLSTSSITGRITVGNEIWLGTNNGIEVFNIMTKSRNVIRRENEKVHTLLSNQIYELFLDSEQRIWISTDKGVSVIDPNIDGFNKMSFIDDVIYSDISAKNGDEYYATSFYSNLVQRVNFKKKYVQDIFQNEHSILSGASSILQSHNNTYIHFYNGLGIIDTNTERVRPFKGENVEIIERRGNVDMVIDDKNNLWVAQRVEHQLISLNLDSGENRIYPLDAEPKGLELQGDSILWIPCIGKIYRYDLKKMVLKEISLDLSSYTSLYGEVIDIHCPPDSLLWISSRVNGLWKAKYENDSLILIKKYALQEGISSMSPINVITDDKGRLVVRTRSGISIYRKEADRFISYDQRNGLDASFIHGFDIVGDSLFVFNMGINIGNLQELKIDINPPKVILESVFVNSERANDLERQVYLKYNENNIQFEYNALNLSNPRAVRYRYRLNDDADWNIVASNSRKALYTSLPPGKYSFQVSATIDGGRWSSPVYYNFEINPPYWKTWWFRTIIFLIIVGMVIAFIRWREKQIKMIGSMRNRMTELENEALRAQMNPHFIFNSLNSIKSFIIRNKKEEAADYLTTFAELIRTILRNSKSNHIPLAEEIKALDLYMEIENIRLEDKFDIEWKVAEDLKAEAILVPPLTLQPFVENAIWHGFIHKEGRGQLIINIEKEGPYLNVSIKDNGIGRKMSKEIEKKHYRKRSFGIAITEQRLRYKDKIKNNIEIIDHYDEKEIALGTEVRLKIHYLIVGANSIISSS